MQVYTAYWLDTPRKLVHGGPSLNYTKWSAVAIEQEGYIDAINTPEWGVDQICEFPVVLFESRPLSRVLQMGREKNLSGARRTNSLLLLDS